MLSQHLLPDTQIEKYETLRTALGKPFRGCMRRTRSFLEDLSLGRNIASQRILDAMEDQSRAESLASALRDAIHTPAST